MARQRLSPAMLQRQRWLRALAIARILCAEEGYHTTYLDEITTFIHRTHLCYSPSTIPPQGQTPTN